MIPRYIPEAKNFAQFEANSLPVQLLDKEQHMNGHLGRMLLKSKCTDMLKQRDVNHCNRASYTMMGVCPVFIVADRKKSLETIHILNADPDVKFHS